MRIGLFGGSFNPPHVAHALVGLYALETQGLDVTLHQYLERFQSDSTKIVLESNEISVDLDTTALQSRGLSPADVVNAINLQNLILPSVTLGLAYVALIARITRAAMLEVLQQDYVRTARAKGLAQKDVLFLHSLKNAAVPIMTVVGIGIALLIGGVVVTESVYAIPGLGRLTVDAVLARDFPTIQGVMLLFSLIYVLVNLIIDLAYTLVDPRIRY